MNYKKRIFHKLFITLFTLSISVTVLPCGLITIHGLFGELRSTIVTEDGRTGMEEVSSTAKKRLFFHGENIYNIWFELSVTVTYLIYVLYMLRLPQQKTIVTLKVRMDD